MGYLPETMRNYLLRLGWSHGDDETISTEQAIEWFNLESIGKSPARMDFKKLDNLNGHYIRQRDDASLADEVIAMLGRETPARTLDAAKRARLVVAMPGLKERAKTIIELTDSAEFLFTDGPRTLDEAAAKILTPDARAALGRIAPLLAQTEWQAAKLEEAARGFAEAEGKKLGQVAQPLRAALTGKTSSPPIFDVLAILGKDETLVRLGTYAG